VNAVDLVPAVRELFDQHPRAARLSPEQVAGLLWILCYVSEDEPPLELKSPPPPPRRQVGRKLLEGGR
jgi:hypothetical protein